jgi:hypothetical protein
MFFEIVPNMITFCNIKSSEVISRHLIHIYVLYYNSRGLSTLLLANKITEIHHFHPNKVHICMQPRHGGFCTDGPQY